MSGEVAQATIGDVTVRADRILFVGLGISAVAYYRCLLPATYLGADWIGVHGEPPELEIATGLVKGRTQMPDWGDYDCVVLQQVWGTKWLALIRRLQSEGKTVLYEVDDYLHGVRKHESHNFKEHFTKKYLAEAQMCMKAADGMICSTEYLASRYRAFNKRVWVAENGLDVTRYRLTRLERPTCTVGWAGATGHVEQLVNWLGAVATTMLHHDHVNFACVGQPEFAAAFGDRFGPHRALGIPFTMIENYPAAMSLFDVALAPAGKTAWYRAKCLDASTRIPTQRGLLPIGEVTVNDSVWSGGALNQVEAIRHESRTAGFRIETELGYSVMVTPDHRLMVDDQWKVASRIRPGDKLALSRFEFGTKMQQVGMPLMHTGIRSDWSPCATATSLPEIKIDEVWGELLGLFAGDGNVNNTTVRISVDEKDSDVVARVVDLFANIGLRAIVRDKKTFAGNPVAVKTVHVCSTKLVAFLDKLGLVAGNGARKVSVPEVIWRSPKSVVSAFLRGYFEADGTTSRHTVSATSKDAGFLRDVQILLLAFGITSRRTRSYGVGRYSDRQYEKLSLRTSEAEIFREQIGFLSTRKNDRLRTVEGQHWRGARRLDIEWLDEVATVEPIELDPIDLQVKGQQFVAAGVVSHNSDLRFLEAGALGIPVIANPVVYPNIEHGVNGFHAETPDEVLELLEELVEDRDLRERVGQAAKEYVYEHRDIANTCLRWLEVAAMARAGVDEPVPT